MRGPLIGPIYVPPGKTDFELILRAASSHLQQVDDPGLAELAGRVGSQAGAWDNALAMARQNRLSAFVLQGLQRNGVSIPPEARTSLEHYRTTTFHMNSRNLLTVRRVAPLIEAEGIDVVVIKGPVQQYTIHGDFFAKPAGDVDLLVRSQDFLRARRILEASGYSLPQECASPWWRIFLGEQHLLSERPDLTTVDLHHRLQQPGAPQPRNLGRFLDNRVRAPVGGATVAVLSIEDAMLLNCMTVVKALIHREPAGGYAADLVVGLGRMTPEARAAFAKTARSLGLRNTVRLALRAVAVLFGVAYDLSAPGEPRMLDKTTDDDLFGMIATPESSGVAWAKRRSILWALNDTGPIEYGREVGWALGGEITRMLFQATPPKAAPMDSAA